MPTERDPARRKRRLRRLAAAAFLAAGVVLAVYSLRCGGESDLPGAQQTHSVAFGYGSVPGDPFSAPEATPLVLPEIEGGDAVWGATGRDSRGHIWFAVSCRRVPEPSARLLEYVPQTGELSVRGDVVSALKRCDVYRQGETQEKIHTKIYQALDGHLYFASTDLTDGDFQAGSRPPKWGGHLWRLRLPENEWEHLMATPEGILALAVSGRFVYALGFFGHELYQYDCQTGATRSVTVGSLGGHISRNIVSDLRGHVYVPRLRRARDRLVGWLEHEQQIIAELVEYDTELREVRASFLEYYVERDPTSSHGLTGFQPMADGSMVVMTSVGFLYRVVPRGRRSARVTGIGWLHPEGRRYAASLFSFAGERYVMGLTTGDKDKETRPNDFEWAVYDLAEGTSSASKLVIGGEDPPPTAPMLLYGSATRDDEGNFYVVGRARAGRPLVLQVHCP